MKQEKKNWLMDYILKNGPVDILNEKFVDQYVDKFNAKHKVQMYGANKCPELSRNLSTLFKEGILTRSTIGVPDLWGMGFPKWVYVYDLHEIYKRDITMTGG